MAILKDLIVHGSSRFLNKIYASEIQTPLIEAETGIFKKLKADDATVVGLLDVKGQLHTNNWSNSNIATIDGSFYITPTIGSDSGTVTITATSLNFSGTNYAVTSLYLGDNSSITWPQYSKVLVTGQILSNGEWIPLGTLLGQLSSAATAASISINNIKDNKNQASNVLSTLVNEGTTSSNYRNLKVSLYQRASSSTAFYPLGIYMTATGDNGRTFLDIYGGVEALSNSNNYGGFAEPNVRIGNLQGLPNVGGQTPSGWGIYTDNGYFKGIIAADRGYIGTGSKYWVIGNYQDDSNSNNDRSYIYNGTNSITSTTQGVYLGTDGIRNYKDSTHYVTIKNGVISALGVDLSGKIIATSGTIGGASITNGTLIVGNANINDINASKINTGDIAAARIQTNLISAINAKVSDLSALTATIGGFQIDSSSVHTKSVAITSNADNSIALSSADFTRTINSTSRTGLRFAIGDKFGVTGDGKIYASSVDLTGKITATSGTIGGINIINGALDVSSIKIGDLKGGKGLSSNNLLQDTYASSLIKENAPWDRYLSEASNTTITGQFIAEANLPDPNATHFYRITDSSASTKGRALCFYSSGTPPFINGHTYRIGCWVRKHAGSPKINITLGSIGMWRPAHRIINNTEWEWFEAVHTFGDTDPDVTTQSDTYKRLYFYFYNNNVAGSSLDMCGFKMEEIQTNSGTARNLLLGTEKLTNWGVVNGATISDGIATFSTITANSWREIYPAKNFKYDLIRNQNVISSIKVRAENGKKCCLNFCVGVESTETAYTRQKYFNQFIYFTGTGDWQTVCTSVFIEDSIFVSGSGTPDYNDCWITVRIGAVNTYWNGFEAKEPQMCLGTTATSWSRAPEDVDETIDNINIGGRNLLKESDCLAPIQTSKGITITYNGNGWFNINGTVTGTSASVLCFYGNTSYTSNITSSGEYTLSIETDGTIFLPSNKTFIQLAYHSDNATNNTIAGEFHILSDSTKVTFTIPENHHISRVCLFIQANATGGVVDGNIRLKLERGNKATDWTPAPEDVVNEAVNKIEVGGRNLIRNSTNFNKWVVQNGGAEGEIWHKSLSGKTSNANARPRTWIGTGYLADYYNKTLTISFEIMSPDWSAIEEGSSYTGLNGLAIQLETVNGTPYSSSIGNTGRYFFKRLGDKNYFKTDSDLVDGDWVKITSVPLKIDDTLWNNSTTLIDGYDYFTFSFILRRNGTVSFRKPQIEIGNKATDFTLAPEDVEADIEDAKKVATNYITQIDNTGIKIAPYDKSGNDYLQLNSNAISMYRNNIETLRIEDNAIRVGKTNEAHFSLTSSRLTGYGNNNNVYFDAGQGNNTAIQLFYGNGDRTAFEMGPLVKGTSQYPKGIKSVKKDGNALTETTDYTIHSASIWYDIYFEEEPAAYSTITIEYISAYKELLYTVGSSQNITTSQQTFPDGHVATLVTLDSQKTYEAKELWVKKSGQTEWQQYQKDSYYHVEQINNNYKYYLYVDTGTQIKLVYFILDDSSFVSDPDVQIEEYLWDITHQGSLSLTIKNIYEINSVKVNNTNVNYTSEGPLYYDYLVFSTAPALNEKIEVEFFTRNYNSQYYSTYLNFSNMNKENSVKGIGAVSFGSENVNKGVFCLVEGASNTVTGYASHAEGYNNVVAGSHAHAGGSNSLALSQNTFVHGDNLQATYLNSAAFGYYNSPENQLFSIGRGNYENAFSINKDGNVQIGGYLLAGTTYADKKPLFKIVEKTFTAHGLSGDGGMAKARDISIPGYRPIASLGYVIANSSGHPTSSQASASWCILSKFWIGYGQTQDHDYDTDDIYYYIWNLNTSRHVTADVTFKFLYIAQTAYLEELT